MAVASLGSEKERLLRTKPHALGSSEVKKGNTCGIKNPLDLGVSQNASLWLPPAVLTRVCAGQADTGPGAGVALGLEPRLRRCSPVTSCPCRSHLLLPLSLLTVLPALRQLISSLSQPVFFSSPSRPQFPSSPLDFIFGPQLSCQLLPGPPYFAVPPSHDFSGHYLPGHPGPRPLT